VARRPLAVAITGGIAAGKSEALASFSRHGAAVASSDEVVHRVYAEDETLKDELRGRWGDAVFGQDGEVDRAAIGRIVFADRAELDWLEQQVHPRVRAVNRAWLEELAARDEPPPLAVVEVPLLYETGAEAGFDRVVAITAPAELRERRRAGVDDRASRLVPEEEKLRRADFAFVNDGTLAELDAFVGGVVETLSSS
jgi:dephospho-CoA kinase